MTKKELGVKIKELRQNKNMTQTELAEKTGVGLRSIQRIEAGGISVGYDILCKIAETLGCRVELIALQKNNRYGTWVYFGDIKESIESIDNIIK